MATHTSGPWTDGRLVGICGQDKAALNLAFVMSPDDERRAECEANARLIAAAPDSHAANVAMVDALNVAFHIKPEWDDERIYDELPTSGVASAYFAARAAIALATGGHR